MDKRFKNIYPTKVSSNFVPEDSLYQIIFEHFDNRTEGDFKEVKKLTKDYIKRWVKEEAYARL